MTVEQLEAEAEQTSVQYLLRRGDRVPAGDIALTVLVVSGGDNCSARA